LNRKRRSLNSSQAAIADVKREQLDVEYAAEIEKVRTEKLKRPNAGRPKKNSGELIPPNKRDDSKRTDATRAKSAGTNRKYIADARKILDEHPDKAEKIARGEKTITQVKRELKEMKRSDRRSAVPEIHPQPVAA
jgi:hypothetical protein